MKKTKSGPKVFIHDPLAPSRLRPRFIKCFIISQILTSAICLSTCSPAFADEKPILVPLGKIDGGEVGAMFPSERVLIVIGLLLGIIKSLVDELRKRKDRSEENETRANITKLFLMVTKLAEKVENLPSEDELVRRIRTDIELIAIKTARKEIERLDR